MDNLPSHDREGVVPAPTYQDLASLIEHTLLSTALSETDVAQGCELARKYQVASVIVRPSDVDLAVRWIAGSSVVLGTIVDWPHGFSSPSVKNFAVRDMLRRGVKEIDTVMNTGKLISRQFQYVEMELLQMVEACHEAGAILKVAIESEYLDDERKILACRICRRAGVDFIAAPALADIPLLKEYGKERFHLKGTGPAASLEEALVWRDTGCTRLQTSSTAAILDAWKARLAAEAQAAAVIS